jgi:hypothetical protein
MHLKRETFDNKTVGQCALELYRRDGALVEIFDGATRGTNKVVMWFRIRIDPQRSAMQVDLVNDPRFQKSMERFVHSRQRHRRHLTTNFLVNLFRIWVSRKRRQRLEDHRTLMRSGHAMRMTKLTKSLRAVVVMFSDVLHKGVDGPNSKRIRV